MSSTSQPRAAKVASMTKEPSDSLQGQLQRLQATLQERDMEVARLKTALYTITTYGDQLKPMDSLANSQSSKNWLSKAFTTSSKSSKSKVAPSGQAIYGTIGGHANYNQNSTILSNMSNGRLVIDELKRQVQESDRRMFETRTQLASSNSQVDSLSKVLESTRNDLQSVAAENDRLKRDLAAAMSSSTSTSQRYESSFTISSQGMN